MAELGKFDDAIGAADNGIRIAPDDKGHVRALIGRAKVYHLAKRSLDSVRDIIAAWKLDADLVISSTECRDLFSEAYGLIDEPTDEQSLLYKEIQKRREAVIVAENNKAAEDSQYALSSAGQ